MLALMLSESINYGIVIEDDYCDVLEEACYAKKGKELGRLPELVYDVHCGHQVLQRSSGRSRIAII